MPLDSDRLKNKSLVRVCQHTDGLGSKGLQVPQTSGMVRRLVLRKDARIRTGTRHLRFRGTSDRDKSHDAAMSSMKHGAVNWHQNFWFLLFVWQLDRQTLPSPRSVG